MGKLFANSEDPDLGLHCLLITFLRVSRLQWVKGFTMVSILALKPAIVKAICGRVKRKCIFEHAQIAHIQIHPTHAQSLIRAFALHYGIL